MLLSGGFSAENIKSMPLWQQGLFVVVIGLIGVFLVLLLFFFVIYFLEKITTKAEKMQKSKNVQ